MCVFLYDTVSVPCVFGRHHFFGFLVVPSPVTQNSFFFFVGWPKPKTINHKPSILNPDTTPLGRRYSIFILFTVWSGESWVELEKLGGPSQWSQNWKSWKISGWKTLIINEIIKLSLIFLTWLSRSVILTPVTLLWLSRSVIQWYFQKPTKKGWFVCVWNMKVCSLRSDSMVDEKITVKWLYTVLVYPLLILVPMMSGSMNCYYLWDSSECLGNYTWTWDCSVTSPTGICTDISTVYFLDQYYSTRYNHFL
jgi:hypothetical protein